MSAAAAHQIVIKAAAVADFAPVERRRRKIKKAEGTRRADHRRCSKNPDILADVADASPRARSSSPSPRRPIASKRNAREKLQRKGADLIVANDVADTTIGFDSDQNEVLVIARDGSVVRFAKASKSVIANRLLDLVVQRMP